MKHVFCGGGGELLKLHWLVIFKLQFNLKLQTGTSFVEKMAAKMTLLDAIRDWANRVHVKPNTLENVWPFQLMEFAACKIWTHNARIEGWFCNGVRFSFTI